MVFQHKWLQKHAMLDLNKLYILSKIYLLNDTLFDMIKAVYHDMPLIFIGVTFREKLVSHHWAVNEADSCVLMRRASSKTMAQTKESHFIGRDISDIICTRDDCCPCPLPPSHVPLTRKQYFISCSVS